MTKHRWRESVKSFYGSHIDPDKDEEEELKGTKIEIEEKIQKILKLLKDEDEDEDGSVIGNTKKETIADLIDFFQKKYQSLYSRYDHLTGELRKKVRGKQGKDSSSSSSSSDSDYSQRKKGSKNGKMENEFQKVADGIKQGLETANVEVDELKSKLKATIEEKETIHSELQAALSKIQDAENTIRDLRIKSESLSDEKSQLFIENGKLTLRLDSAGILEAQLNQKLEDYSRENESLILEKETAKKSIEDEKKITEDLRAITDRLKDEKEVLQQEQEAVKKELSTTREQLESAEGDVAKLSETQKAFEEENNSLSSKILELSDEIKQMQDKIQEVMAECSQLREKMGEKERELSSHMEMHEAHKSEGSTRLRGLELELEDQIRNKNHDIDQLREDGERLQGKISELEKMLMERGDQFVALAKKLEDAENEASAQIATLTEQINTLQQELVSLKDEKSQLEVQIERHKQELESNIMDQERTSKEREDAFNKLSEEHKQHEVWFEECKENLQVAEKKVESMAEEFKKNIESKDQKVDELEETIEVLTRDVEIKGDEVSTLAENVSVIEVKLRLSNQKLRITEQLLTEKEDSQRNKEEKLQQQQKFLEERIATMSGIIATYKSVQLKMKTEISERVNSTLNGMDTLTMKFEEDYGHIESCVYGTFNELQVAKNWVKETKCEKEQLKKEVANLVEELKHEREQESILRDRIGEQETTITELGTKLQKDEEEKKILINAAKQFEVKMGELEKLINEKDEGILGLEEEKREAIKQLSMWADYHRSRCDLLKEMLSMTHGGRGARGRRQITT